MSTIRPAPKTSFGLMGTSRRRICPLIGFGNLAVRAERPSRSRIWPLADAAIPSESKRVPISPRAGRAMRAAQAGTGFGSSRSGRVKWCHEMRCLVTIATVRSAPRKSGPGQRAENSMIRGVRGKSVKRHMCRIWLIPEFVRRAKVHEVAARSGNFAAPCSDSRPQLRACTVGWGAWQPAILQLARDRSWRGRSAEIRNTFRICRHCIRQILHMRSFCHDRRFGAGTGYFWMGHHRTFCKFAEGCGLCGRRGS
jgi:hypothetical protein